MTRSADNFGEMSAAETIRNLSRPTGRTQAISYDSPSDSYYATLVNMSTQELVKKKAPSLKYKHTKSPKKSDFSEKELLEIVDDLVKKEIGDIFISGSLALFLQGKLNRCEFKDLDLVYSGNLELDEEIEDYRNGDDYPNAKHLKSVIYLGVPIDLFKAESINYIPVLYDNKTYLCQNYKDVIKAKLEMSLSTMKDRDYLFSNFIDINIK